MTNRGRPSAKVNSIPCNQARFVGREVRDDARDIVSARDVDQIVASFHMPSNLVGHPSRIGHRWMDDIGCYAQRCEFNAAAIV